MQALPDKVVFLNLDSRPDRREHFLKSIGTTCLRDLPIERYSATPVDKYIVPRWWKWAGAPAQQFQEYQYLTGMDHLQIIQRSYAAGLQTVLVCEDDAHFLPGFDDAFLPAWNDVQTQKGWQGMVLGGYDWETPTPVTPFLTRLKATAQSHAYILNRDGMFRTYEHCSYWPRQVIDWAMGDLHRIEPNYYGMREHLVKQVRLYEGDCWGRQAPAPDGRVVVTVGPK